MGRKGEELPKDDKEALKLFSSFLAQFLFLPLQRKIEKELKKFEEKIVEGQEEENDSPREEHDLMAYISKNKASFFAKASAGICTSNDIPLFARKDHFHLNVVQGGSKVVGNIQCYLIEEGTPRKRKRSLVMRGFNPTMDFLKHADASAFAEQALMIGKIFVKDNGFAHLYITGQSSWHELSNRDQVGSYLKKRYLKEEKRRPIPLALTSSHGVEELWEVGGEDV